MVLHHQEEEKVVQNVIGVIAKETGFQWGLGVGLGWGGGGNARNAGAGGVDDANDEHT